jgi:hypothetical protein
VAKEQEEGEIEGEKGDELRMGGRHAVALAVHSCKLSVQRPDTGIGNIKLYGVAVLL